MITLFSKKKPVSQARGMDGYRECDRVTLAWFQKTYEQSNPDAVRCALLAARDPNFLITKQSLVRFVQNEDWTVGGGTYN